jgi:TatD DNase family protein
LKGYRHIRLALGLHPLKAVEGKTQLALFRKLVGQTSYIGEIGLDFSREGVATKDEQLEVLRDVLSAIRGKKKVVSVHSRKAEKDLLELLCEYEIENVIFHWYSGSVNLIPAILEQGYYFSVNEAMCLSKNGRAIIEKIPKDRLLTETDAPYNEKQDIKAVLSFLNLTEKEVYNNFRMLLKGLG